MPNTGKHSQAHFQGHYKTLENGIVFQKCSLENDQFSKKH